MSFSNIIHKFAPDLHLLVDSARCICSSVKSIITINFQLSARRLRCFACKELSIINYQLSIINLALGRSSSHEV